jgi:hypothetical protein
MASQDLDTVLAGGKGAISGGSKGLALGSNPALLAATGGLSAPIGAAAGAIIGGVGSAVKQDKANKAQEVPLVDPLEMRRLARLEQTRKNILTGSDPVTRNRIDQARNQGAAVRGAISRNTGGDVSSTIDALLKSQKNTQASINQGVSAGQQRLPYFDNAAGVLTNKIANRKLQLGLLDRSQKMAENAQSRKEANLNANAFLGTDGGTQTFEQALAALKAKYNKGDGSSDLGSGATDAANISNTYLPNPFTQSNGLNEIPSGLLLQNQIDQGYQQRNPLELSKSLSQGQVGLGNPLVQSNGLNL